MTQTKEIVPTSSRSHFFFLKKERKKDIQNKEEENIFSSSFDINTYYTVP